MKIVAWMTEDGERVITATTKDGQIRDGGASLSAMRPYTVALARLDELMPEHWRDRAKWITSSNGLSQDERGRLAVMLLRAVLANPAYDTTRNVNFVHVTSSPDFLRPDLDDRRFWPVAVEKAADAKDAERWRFIVADGKNISGRFTLVRADDSGRIDELHGGEYNRVIDAAIAATQQAAPGNKTQSAPTSASALYDRAPAGNAAGLLEELFNDGKPVNFRAAYRDMAERYAKASQEAADLREKLANATAEKAAVQDGPAIALLAEILKEVDANFEVIRRAGGFIDEGTLIARARMLLAHKAPAADAGCQND